MVSIAEKSDISELKVSYINLGNKLFLLGVFFLPSALPISAFFLLISLIISFSKKKYFILKDKWNYPLFLSIGIILFSCLNISLINKSPLLINYDTNLIWFNLFNWIPIFILFWGFQYYLNNQIQRIRFAQFLVSGTFPVILSIIFQKYFNWYGPHKTFYGLIIWFQKDYCGKEFARQCHVAGLFSNPNYAGIWLVLVLPFSFYLLRKASKSFLEKLIKSIFCFSFFYMSYLTGSRNALIGLLISILIFFGFRKSILISIFLSFTLLAGNIIFTFFGLSNSFVITNSTIQKILEFNFFAMPRIEIWMSALSRIHLRPILGWGPSTFSYLHYAKNDAFVIPKSIVKASHSHNISLELAHNFGIPLAIIITATIIIFLFIGFKSVYLKKDNNDSLILNKAWFASSLIIFITHLSDITLYDGKIGILISIIFSGLRCIINEKYTNLNQEL